MAAKDEEQEIVTADVQVRRELADTAKGQWLSDVTMAYLFERICLHVAKEGVSGKPALTLDPSIVGSMGGDTESDEATELIFSVLDSVVSGDWALRRPSIPLILLPIGNVQAKANAIYRNLDIRRAMARARGQALSRNEKIGEAHGHWSLLVRDSQTGEWYHYDSNSRNSEDEHGRLANHVADIFEARLTGRYGTRPRRLPRMPMQTAAECGFFTLLMAYDIAEMGHTVYSDEAAVELGWARPFPDRFQTYHSVSNVCQCPLYIIPHLLTHFVLAQPFFASR
jgi:hypothetical protein